MVTPQPGSGPVTGVASVELEATSSQTVEACKPEVQCQTVGSGPAQSSVNNDVVAPLTAERCDKKVLCGCKGKDGKALVECETCYFINKDSLLKAKMVQNRRTKPMKPVWKAGARHSCSLRRCNKDSYKTSFHTMWYGFVRACYWFNCDRASGLQPTPSVVRGGFTPLDNHCTTKQCVHCKGIKYVCCNDPDPETEQESRRQRAIVCQNCEAVINRGPNRFFPMDADWQEDTKCQCDPIYGPVWGMMGGLPERPKWVKLGSGEEKTKEKKQVSKPRKPLASNKKAPSRNRNLKLEEANRREPEGPSPKTKEQIAQEQAQEKEHLRLMRSMPTTTELHIVKYDGSKIPVVKDALAETRWKVHENQRRVCLYGRGKYKYAKMEMTAYPKTEFVRECEEYARQALDRYNIKYGPNVWDTCLVNHYPKSVRIPKHRDDEVEIDQSAGIVSLSLGGQDIFRCTDNRGKCETNWLKHGDVAFMPPGFQNDWMHETLGRHRSDRISLTWRAILNPEGTEQPTETEKGDQEQQTKAQAPERRPLDVEVTDLFQEPNERVFGKDSESTQEPESRVNRVHIQEIRDRRVQIRAKDPECLPKSLEVVERPELGTGGGLFGGTGNGRGREGVRRGREDLRDVLSVRGTDARKGDDGKEHKQPKDGAVGKRDAGGRWLPEVPVLQNGDGRASDVGRVDEAGKSGVCGGDEPKVVPSTRVSVQEIEKALSDPKGRLLPGNWRERLEAHLRSTSSLNPAGPADLKVTQNKGREWLMQFDLEGSGIYGVEQFIESALEMCNEICANKGYAERAAAAMFNNRTRLQTINKFLKSNNAFGCLIPGWMFVILFVGLFFVDYLAWEGIIDAVYPTYVETVVDPSMKRFRLAMLDTMEAAWWYMEMVITYSPYIFFVVSVVNFFLYKKWERNMYWVVLQLVICFGFGFLVSQFISGVTEHMRAFWLAYGNFGPTRHVNIRELYQQAELPENLRRMYVKLTGQIDWIEWVLKEQKRMDFFGISSRQVIGMMDQMTFRGYFTMAFVAVGRTMMYVVGLRRATMVFVPLGGPN